MCDRLTATATARSDCLDTKCRLPYDLVCAIILKVLTGIVGISTDFFALS